MADQLVVAPDDPTRMVLRSTFGLLFTTDSGTTWDWLCETAIPSAGNQDPAISLLNGGVVLSGQDEGLATSPDFGCSWSFVPGTAQTLVVDVARAIGGTSAIAIKNVYASTSDAGVLLYDTQMLQTVDVGKTWNPLPGVIDPTLVIDTCDVAPSNSARIYVTGQVYGATQAMMLVSQDTGQSYLEYPIPLSPDELGAYIAAVDPNNADVIYVRTIGLTDAGAKTSRLLVSTDGGKTWAAKWAGDLMLGFALNKDGTRVYIGTILAGLLAADTTTFAFVQKSPFQIHCLTTLGDTLYACGGEWDSGFILGSTENEGASFTTLLKLETVRGPITCPPNTSAASCAAVWPTFEALLGIDAGHPKGDAGAAPDAGTSTCGCESADLQSRDAVWLAVAFAVWFGWRRRKLA